MRFVHEQDVVMRQICLRTTAFTFAIATVLKVTEAKLFRVYSHPLPYTLTYPNQARWRQHF